MRRRDSLDGSALTILAVHPAHPQAVQLMAELDADLADRYGHAEGALTQRDVEDARITLFLAWVDAEPAGCGAFRHLGHGEGEIKRMFVRSAYRGYGIARRLLSSIEAEARHQGLVRLRLETGSRQPEALALYESAGYRPSDPFGEYRVTSLSRFFVKDLPS
jgi:GNAT superfamily N-acetyltransferase